MCKRKLILASASPRRKELLTQAGAEFEIIPAEGDEVLTRDTPEEAVLELSRQKAKEVAGRVTDKEALVLGADTVVAYRGQILGKPKNEADAVGMLTMLSGNTHSVYTGVTLIDKGQKDKLYQFFEETKVTMYPMSQREIEAYAGTGEPMDKAGAYGIQGKCAIYIARISGDYNNVVGLPIARIYQEMKQLGIEIYGNS